jgi:hypothetical protein
MRALICRRGNITIVGREHGELFKIISENGMYPLNKLTERDRVLADQLYQWDLLNLVGEGEFVGYESVVQDIK